MKKNPDFIVYIVVKDEKELIEALKNWKIKRQPEISKSKWVYSLVKQLQWMRLFIAQGDE